MKIGIYGGSFNPPHIAHLVVAESIRDQFGLDQILWIPGYIPPHKTHLRLADASHRMAMTRLAIARNPFFDVSAIEIERKGTSFTIDTVSTLVETYPENEYYLVIGEDSLLDFMTWHKPASIVEKVELLVYRRPGREKESAEASTLFPNRIHLADAPLLGISSASIRIAVKEKRSIRHLVPDDVYDYIVQHALYQ
ncbi:MAG: nicotinate (nicotinamide) nucleotide adenylyltransferase [Rhodothermales bacterium]